MAREKPIRLNDNELGTFGSLFPEDLTGQTVHVKKLFIFNDEGLNLYQKHPNVCDMPMTNEYFFIAIAKRRKTYVVWKCFRHVVDNSISVPWTDEKFVNIQAAAAVAPTCNIVVESDTNVDFTKTETLSLAKYIREVPIEFAKTPAMANGNWISNRARLDRRAAEKASVERARKKVAQRQKDGFGNKFFNDEYRHRKGT